MEDLNAGNPADSGNGNPTPDPSASLGGTGTPSGEASQSATGKESFIPQGVDINTLPPQVRAQIEKINSDMVRGFTEKTTKLSETIKAESAKSAEAYRQKAEFYDQIATQDEFVKQWNDYVQKMQAAGTPAQTGDPVLIEMKQKLDEVNQKIQLTEMAQVTDAFAEAVDEKGAKLHPEFDQLNGFSIGQLRDGESAEDFSLLRGCIELAPGNSPQEKLANGYKAAKAVYDSIYEAGRKAGMGRLAQKAQNGSLPPSHSNGGEIQITNQKPKSAREALEMAKRGMMVSRD
jgi:hypothetical protein